MKEPATPATDLERVQQLIQRIGNPYRAAQVFNSEMERRGYKYRMDATSTMQRIARGEARPAMIAFVCYVLSDAV